MHKAFFGDRERDFSLTPHLIPELERLAGRGITAVIDDTVTHRRAWFDDIVAIIRLGLVGGGTHPEEAAALVKTYVPIRPLGEAHLLALDILVDLWSGPDAQPTGEDGSTNNDAAATGDMAAAINGGAA
jgi:hypothetical protein